MEEAGDGRAAVEAEVGALRGIVTTKSVHILVVILVEEIMTDIMATTVVGPGCLEAVVLNGEEGEVEVQGEEIGVHQLEKVVRKGEPK